MGELLEIVGEQVGAVAGHPLVVFSVQATIAYLCILWLAASFWVFRDLHHRTRDPISPYVAAAAVVVFTPLFFPLAVLAYRLMRPSTTLAERRLLDLESELLARQAAGDGCPACDRPVDAAWTRCPACGERIGTGCPACGERIALDWSVCAWCAHDLEVAAAVRRAPVAVATQDPAPRRAALSLTVVESAPPVLVAPRARAAHERH